MSRTMDSEISNFKSGSVPTGYKQTEVGVIPAEWDAVPLKGKVSIAHGFAFASEHFASHGPYRLATPGHFYETGGFRDIGEKQKYYVGPVPSDYVLQPGDVIVAMTEQADGLLGSAAVIPDEHGYLHNQRLGRATVLSSEIQLDYLVYVFNSPSYRTKVRETAAGTKVKHTSPEKLLEISVRLPPLPEQRAIATALSDVDGLLNGLDRLIAKKRDLKQAAMQQLLTGQTRLPGFHGEWEWKMLPDVSRFRGGKAHEQYIADHGQFVCVNSKFISTEGKVCKYSTANFCRGRTHDILMVMSDLPNGKALAKTFLVDQDDLYAVNQRVCALTPFDDYCAPFLAYVLDRNPYFLKFDDGVSQTHLLNRVFQKCPIFVPPTKAEQTAIAEVLTDMDAELAALEQRRNKTRALKQAMMQELLTGKTRLV